MQNRRQRGDGCSPHLHLAQRFVRFLLTLSIFLGCWGGTPSYGQTEHSTASTDAVPLTAATVEAFFDELIAQQMQNAHVVGATVAVVKGDALLFAKGYGYANQAQQVPVVAAQTLFFPGSTGKLLTWTALMQLVEQGKLDLHGDVNQYLDFTIPATYPEPITIAHLLTHTSGFEEQLAALLVAGGAEVQPLGDFLRTWLPTRIYPPGTTFAYSNYATALAGYIVERVSGEPYVDYITKHILEPLAMTQSAAGQPLPPALMADLSKGYHYRNGQYTTVDYEWIADVPAAPLHTTATDIANFMIAYLNQGRFGDAQLVQPATSAAMLQKQFAHDPHVNGVGYGFMISTQNGKTLAWHTGGSAYFNTMLALIPEEQVGFFLSFNTPVGDLYQPLVSFVDHFYPAPPVTDVPPPSDTAQQIAALSGSYVSSRVARHSAQKLATWQAESLTVQPGPEQTLQVGMRTYRPVEPGIFRQVDGPRTLVYRTDAQGNVTQLFWGQFAYFKIPAYQSTLFQLLVTAGALLLMLTGVVVWPIGWLVQRRRRDGRDPKQPRWSAAARWSAVLFALFNTVLLGWFLFALLAYAENFVYPVALSARLTQLWWINVPLLLLLLLFTGLAWRQRVWSLAGRLYYTLVTLAGLFVLYFLWNWNLLAL